MIRHAPRLMTWLTAPRDEMAQTHDNMAQLTSNEDLPVAGEIKLEALQFGRLMPAPAHRLAKEFSILVFPWKYNVCRVHNCT